MARSATQTVKSNDEQKQVVETTESPLLVIAGPGAGKTKTLVDRVCHLVYDLNVAPENIFVGTFTEKAAKELLSRISTVSATYDIQKNISEIRVGTLHSLFLDFLEEYREYTDLRRGYRVLDDFEQQYLTRGQIQTGGWYFRKDSSLRYGQPCRRSPRHESQQTSPYG